MWRPSQCPFQSTPSVGRATRYSINSRPAGGISIHALRGEGDFSLIIHRNRGRMISIHALRGEGDGRFITTSVLDFLFQSTPSVGRATQIPYKLEQFEDISIHALRGEGDESRGESVARMMDFNPRPPWGGRLAEQNKKQKDLAFQSTPSVGRATTMICSRRNIRSYFNPRPPWGGRHNCRSAEGSNFHDFNPRPPWGGRLVTQSFKNSYHSISIHALRGEGDK